MKQLFKLKNQLPRRTVLIIEISGLVFFLALWYMLTYPRESTSVEFRSAEGQEYTYRWTGPDGFDKSFSTDDHLPNVQAGKYTLTVQNAEGGKASQAFEVPAGVEEKIVKTPVLEAEKGQDIALYVEILNEKNGIVSKTTLPAPLAVLTSYKELHFENALVRNTFISLKLNVLGYLLAIVSSLILGFVIGLIPFFRSLLGKYIDAIRFVPLAAVTGLFIAWFGIETNMKVQFLAFGIFVFLIPVVVQRVDEVQKIHTQTAYTLGATNWQLVRNVYWPNVVSKIIDDIRVLTAISWTYIIVAELVNIDGGGLGTLIHKAQRMGRLDKVFALLLLIILIGIIQDIVFAYLDKKINPHKYV